MAPANNSVNEPIKTRFLLFIVIFLALVYLFAPHAARAENENKVTNFSPVKMLVQEGDHVAIKGFRGSVEYSVDAKAKDLQVAVREQVEPAALKYQDEWQFSFKREGSEIQIFIDSPTSKQVWSEVSTAAMQPEFFIKVIGPSLPLNINWNEGRIVVTNLSSEINITAIKADVIVSKGEGDLRIASQEGSVIVRERKGHVNVDSYFAKVQLENLEGKLDLENFTGDSHVLNHTGDVNLNTFRGATQLAGVKGRLEFKNGNSPLRIEKFEGELRGQSGQGAVYVDIRGTADVRVQTAEGAVNLKLPSSGAWVNLGTAEGSLAVPNFLKLTRLQSQQIRTGRLKGSSGGSVFVRTTTGDIRLR